MNRRHFPIVILALVLIHVCFPLATACADGNTARSVVYGDTTTTVPKYRTWNGSAWSSEASAMSVGGRLQWILTLDCPVRKELLVACGDNQNDLNLMVYDGASWGNLVEVSANLVTDSDRPFHAAYSQNSGTALVVFRSGSGNPMYYRTWNGTAWSSQSTTSLSGTGDAKYVKLVPKRGSNEIILVCLDNNNDVSAMVWDGSTFGNKVLLDANAAFASQECFDAAYEQSSGRCLIAWTRSGTTAPRYRIWSGSAWLSEGAMPDVGGNAKQIRMAPDPGSDKVIAMTLDGGADVNLFVWDGNNWGAPSEVQSSVPSTDRRGIDVAFEPAGTRALAMYARSSQSTVRYRVYDGVNWSSEQIGPDISQPISVVQLSPSSRGSEILIGIERKNDGALISMRWNGSSLVDIQTLASDLGGPNGNECFMISNAPRANSVKVIRWREVPNPDPITP